MVIAVLYYLILFLFLGIQLYLWWIWRKFKSPEKPVRPAQFPSVSILIPVYNEEDRVRACLRSLINQNYPSSHLQIIVINDHSTDRTTKMASEFPDVVMIHQIEGLNGKKAAIHSGIQSSIGEIILTTDGDCEVSENWVASMVGSIEKDSNVLVTGPVWMTPDSSGFMQRYQELEQAALNVLTFSGLKSGLILSASGANMAYSRLLYIRLDPFSENQHIPSGDDVFFAQKVHQTGGEVLYAKNPNSMVYTTPVHRFSDFIRQRLRWAGKSSDYTHWPTKLYLTSFGAVNLLFVILLIAGFWNPVFYSYVFYGLLFKFLVDYLIIYTGMRWGHRAVCWQDVLKASLFQVLYVVWISILLVVRKKGRWKT